MPIPGYAETLATMQVDGPALASFTTAVSCLSTPARKTIAPDDWYLGKRLWISAQGRIGNVVTAAPTFTFEFRLGPTSNIVAFTTGAVLCSTTAHTTLPFWLDIMLTCRAIGSGTSANLMGQARILGRPFVDASGADVTTIGHPDLIVPETNPAVGTGFDSSVANVADLFVSCSASNAANTVQLTQYSLVDMGGG